MTLASGKANFVIVMAEQFGANVCAGYGNNFVFEPNIASLVSESVCFENAYCPAPICGPSRFSFLTGNYVCHTRAYDNGSAIPDHFPTYAHLFTANDYQTAMCGRMHIHGLDQHHGFEQRLVSEIINPVICSRADWPGKLVPIKPLPPAKKIKFKCPVSDSPIYRHDDYVTQRACKFIEDYSANAFDEPFMMTVGYMVAHPGTKGKPEYEKLYQSYIRKDFPVPSFTAEDYDDLGEHTKRYIQCLGCGREIFNPDFHRHELALYYSRCTYLDQQIGILLKKLKETGREKDTYFIFTSDHGDLAGNHGCWGKPLFYKEAQNIPLIIRRPGSAVAHRVQGRVSLVDILPTLAELADIKVDFPVDGISFASAIQNTHDAPGVSKDTIFSEYHGYLSPGSMYMMVKGQYKYCHYLQEQCELFNIEDDPNEMHNLLLTPGYENIRNDMESGIRAVVNIEEQEKQIECYNQRRDAVFAALSRSRALTEQTEKNIDAFRKKRNEPWWDNGQYLSDGEKRHKVALAE